MTQTERRTYLIQTLLDEQKDYQDITIPTDEKEQKQLLRALFNVRMPHKITEEFFDIQDAYLQTELKAKGITDYKTLMPIEEDIYLWRGDITTLKCDAIVNAANSQMLGCFYPNHHCIDNAIHTFAGIQLRDYCAKLMQAQKHEEPTGYAKITPAFNLPSRYILHTVGPIVYDALTKKDIELLAFCYRSCLELAEQNAVKSIAFCCISTGEFHFPNDIAAEIAIQTVKEYQKQTHHRIEVIFNVFKELDYQLYKGMLGGHTEIKKEN